MSSDSNSLSVLEERWLELLDHKDVKKIVAKSDPNDCATIPRLLSVLAASESFRQSRELKAKDAELARAAEALVTSQLETKLERTDVQRLNLKVELLTRNVNSLMEKLSLETSVKKRSKIIIQFNSFKCYW